MIRLLRSLLFVPGNNEKMVTKAISSDMKCDALIFDLEDSVPDEQKENARQLILSALEKNNDDPGKQEIWIRINQLDGLFCEKDISAFSPVDKISGFVVPKAEEETIRSAFQKTGKRLIPLIESAKGFVQMEKIASSDGIVGISYGSADMAHSMNGSLDLFRKNEYLRTKLSLVARSFDLEAIDQVFFDVEDLRAFRDECNEAKGLGYSGKLLIHPKQVEIANEVFSKSSEEEIAWAKEVVQMYESSVAQNSKGALKLHGQLVDAVHYKLAKNILKEEEEEVDRERK